MADTHAFAFNESCNQSLSAWQGKGDGINLNVIPSSFILSTLCIFFHVALLPARESRRKGLPLNDITFRSVCQVIPVLFLHMMLQARAFQRVQTINKCGLCKVCLTLLKRLAQDITLSAQALKIKI